MRSDKRIKAVLFDFDDTLITWEHAEYSWIEYNRPRWATIHDFFTADGHTLPNKDDFAHTIQLCMRRQWEEALPVWGSASFIDGLVEALAEMGVGRDLYDLDHLLELYNWQPVPGVKPFDDTHAVLTELKARGYQIGLITNAFQPMWMRDIELNAFDLMKYIDARITSGDTRFMKPHPAIYWRMLGLLNLMPQDAVFVGDRPDQDILGAHNVDMTSVLIEPPHLNRDRQGIEATFTIKTLTELLPILDRLEDA